MGSAESLQDDESDLAESASFVASRSMEPEGHPNKYEIQRIFFYGSIAIAFYCEPGCQHLQEMARETFFLRASWAHGPSGAADPCKRHQLYTYILKKRFIPRYTRKVPSGFSSQPEEEECVMLVSICVA